MFDLERLLKYFSPVETIVYDKTDFLILLDLSKHVVNDFSDIKDLMDRGNSIRFVTYTNHEMLNLI